MKSFKIPIIVGVLIILVLIFYFVIFRKSKDNNEIALIPDTTEHRDDKALTGETIKGKITDLLNSSKEMKCSYKYIDGETSSTTTIYISDKKMRGSSEVKTENEDIINTDFITVDNTMYTWNNQTEKGFKISIDPEDIENNQENQEKYEFMTDKYEYECIPWVIDPSMFTLPKDKEFVDMSGLTKMFDSGSDGESSMCAACEFAQTDEEKNECLSNLGCK